MALISGYTFVLKCALELDLSGHYKGLVLISVGIICGVHCISYFMLSLSHSLREGAFQFSGTANHRRRRKHSSSNHPGDNKETFALRQSRRRHRRQKEVSLLSHYHEKRS